MRASLRLIARDTDTTIDLPKGALGIGSGESDAVKLQGAGIAPGAAVFRWDPRAATWNLHVGQGEVALNGRIMPPGSVSPLNDQDSIELPGVFLRYSSAPDLPLLNGQPAGEIILGDVLVLGRKDPGDAASAVPKLELDPEDSAISKVHVKIEREGGACFISDQSKFGTELNGKSFTRERLIYGDRFRIRGYIFEFTGDRIRLLDQSAGGSIRARDLVFKAGGRTILKGVSLDVRGGEFIGILGGSGQGKSTLLNALCGINPATSGQVFISGIPLSDRAAMSAAGIGFVPQDDIVHKELTVREALTFSARLRLTLARPEIDALVGRTIDRLGLAEHAEKRILMLSGGQRKRVSIGIELLAKPSVLFLDEPSSGLDPATEESLMALLQSLTLTNLTVICTTHVLQKAYLFDRIIFIQGGRLVFAGTPDEARRHFLLGAHTETREGLQRSPLERIYSLLINSTEPAENWEKKFLESPFAADLLSPEPLPSGAGAVSSRQRVKSAGFFGSLRILLERQWRILVSDPLNVLFLLAQAAVIGLLIAWVSDDESLRLFLVVIATMWFGCSNGAQQIVAELPIFRRERVCGLGMHPYILGKTAFLLGLTAAQAVLLFFTVQTASHIFHPRSFDREAFEEKLHKRMKPPERELDEAFDENFDPLADAPEADPKPEWKGPGWQAAPLAFVAWFFDLDNNILQSGDRDILDEKGDPIRNADGSKAVIRGRPVWEIVGVALGLRALALLLAAAAGVGLGLAISALVQTPTQAVMWVPLLLIPQILFGGYVVKFAEMSAPVRAVSSIMPSYLVQRVMDVSNLYGQTTPFLTNRTKTPLFLTSDGAKETVKWERGGRKLSQDYDKLSEFNTSWQNLLIEPDKVGQHKQAFIQGASGFGRTYRDSVERRDDVRYEKGTLFRFLTPAWHSAGAVSVWLLLCYGLVWFGLRSRQTGK